MHSRDTRNYSKSFVLRMFGMVVERVFITDLQKIAGIIERKVVAVGMSNLLIDCPAMLEAPYNSYYPRLLAALVEFFELPQDQTLLPEDDVFPEVDDTVGYQVGYSQLICARNPRQDPLLSKCRIFFILVFNFMNIFSINVIFL